MDDQTFDRRIQIYIIKKMVLKRVSTGHIKESLQSNVRTPISHLQEAPSDVIAAMVDEADWDFDILKLEKASNHRLVVLTDCESRGGGMDGDLTWRYLASQVMALCRHAIVDRLSWRGPQVLK